MKIGIVGAGHIGKTLALKLSAAGHDVKVANSRGPETLRGLEKDLGAKGRAVAIDEAAVTPELKSKERKAPFVAIVNLFCKLLDRVRSTVHV